MNIIHISTYENIGGAAIAASRLNYLFRENGIDSNMLVAYRNTNIDYVKSFKGFKKKIIILNSLFSEYIRNKILKCSYTFSLGWFGNKLYKSEYIKNADVIFIHWIGFNYLSIKDIAKILKLNKPTYFFMHDMWMITGGCHHSFECNLYQTKCIECPLIKNKYLKKISTKTFDLKMKNLSKHNNLHIITPSYWLAECTKSSSIFKSNSISVIPNPVDTHIFKPFEKKTARAILNLPMNKKIILFGANGGKSDKYKGWDYLISAISLLKRNDIALVLFGGYLTAEEEKSLNYPAYSFGYLNDVYSTTLLYNAADVFVTPSLAESFGLTVLESISCGTYSVGFNIGGIPDIIKHKITGYLAQYKDVCDLATGINWALDNSDNCPREKLHKFANDYFSYNSIYQQYCSLFETNNCMKNMPSDII